MKQPHKNHAFSPLVKLNGSVYSKPFANSFCLGASMFQKLSASFFYRKNLFIQFALLMTIFSFVGCDKSASQTPAPLEQTIANVKIAPPLMQEITEIDEYTGHIEAVNNVEIRARISGHLEKVNFTAGSKVKKGDLLFEIDPKPFQAQLNYANAELERAQTKYELAKNDFDRAENLLKEKAISLEEHDARAKNLRETQAAMLSADANVYTAKLNLDYTQIKAPISGRISRELVTVGNLVNPNGASTLLTTIISTNPVYVYVDADEKSILKYRRATKQADLKGMPVDLALADETEFVHHGKIDYLAPNEDRATGTVALRGVFENPDELLSAGFFAKMRVKGANYNAILLPENVIGFDQSRRFVWVIDEKNQVQYRPVTLGQAQGKFRVIKDGISPQDLVVIEGGQRLKAGVTVNSERISLEGGQS